MLHSQQTTNGRANQWNLQAEHGPGPGIPHQDGHIKTTKMPMKVDFRAIGTRQTDGAVASATGR